MVLDQDHLMVRDAVRTFVREAVTPHAVALGCMGEIDRCRTIVGSGTSADTQLAIFEACQKDESRVHALSAVTDWIASATLQ